MQKKIPIVSEKEQVIDESLEVDGKEYYITGVSMGNPHAGDFSRLFPKGTGALENRTSFENHKRFPDRVIQNLSMC